MAGSREGLGVRHHLFTAPQEKLLLGLEQPQQRKRAGALSLMSLQTAAAGSEHGSGEEDASGDGLGREDTRCEEIN